MSVIRSVAFGVLLASAGGLAPAGVAQAQVVTREISEQPVETTISRYPDRTVVTRRPVAPTVGAVAVEPVLPAVVPSVARAVPYDDDVVVQSYPALPAVTETVGAPIDLAPGPRQVRTVSVRRPVMTRTVAPTTRPVRVSTARRPVVHRTRATVGSGSVHYVRHLAPVRRTIRTARTTARPLVLDPVQRSVTYRTIVQQQVVPVPAATEVVTYPAPAVVAPAATTGYALSYPASYPPAAYASATYPAYPVGSAIPAGVTLAPVPETVAVQVPSVRPYQYAVVNNRVLLVDPVTGTVVADVTP